MSKRITSNNNILEAVHETAQDLHDAGFIDFHRMRRYDALCLESVPMYSSKNIRELRNRNNLSQTVFASVLNTSPSTIRQWETGARYPSESSLKLLNLLDKKGLEALI